MPEPIILSTWRFGQKANAAGWPHLSGEKPSALDAVEEACRAIEADTEVTSVGLGGYPDRSGQVTLDAAIMLSPSQCGSVCYVRRFKHAITIARLVMEKSQHVLLAGDGADRFAALHGMTPSDLLTEPARAAWQRWLAEHPVLQRIEQSVAVPAEPLQETWPDAEAHDTVGVLALDAAGRLAGACSTSGMPLKLPGRVGDSPIIGQGLYVHPQHGAAVATGLGELIMGTCSTFLAVELMRRGASPLDAAAEAMQRIVDSFALREEYQAAIITLAPDGHWSSAALRPGFHVAVRAPTCDEVVDPARVMLAATE